MNYVNAAKHSAFMRHHLRPSFGNRARFERTCAAQAVSACACAPGFQSDF